MITAAFFISLAACLVLAGLLFAARDFMRERSRVAMERQLGKILEGVVAADAEHASGRFAGMDVAIEVGHDAVIARVELPEAVLPYGELLDRFGTEALAERMEASGCALVGPNDLELTVVREAELADSLATLGKRLAVVREVREMRRFAAAELASRVPTVRSAYEVDTLLDQLSAHFPEAPETREAFYAAAARYNDKRLAEWGAARLAERQARPTA